ncbi:MAG TPA: Crp/Fnr family transcriptional regulator [Terriglobales bacterium]
MASTHPATSRNAFRSFESCFLFKGLEPAHRDALVARARLKHFNAGQMTFLMGSPGDSMMAVLNGKVRISLSSAGGKEIVLATLQEGEVFGEIAMLDGKERTADAQAITGCDLAILERRNVLAFLEKHPSACLRLVEVFCQRMRLTDERIGEVAMLQLPARLARALLRIANEQKVLSNAKDQALTIGLSQRELGNLIGAAREPVNKCLSVWQRSGIVQVEDGRIIILNRDKLEKVAEEAD